jgi:hypothetical protein
MASNAGDVGDRAFANAFARRVRSAQSSRSDLVV